MHLGFRTRLMLGTTVLVVAFVATAATALAVLIDRFAARQAAQQIADARASCRMQMERLLESWRRETRTLARSPTLLATAAIPEVDEATFADPLDDIPEAPVLAVLDAAGRVVAQRGGWPTGDNLTSMPGMPEALRGGTVDHVWPHPNGLAIVAVTPMIQGDQLLGALVRGEVVDTNLAGRLGASTGSDAVLVHEGRILATSWRDGPHHDVDLSAIERLHGKDLPPDGIPLDLVVDGSARPGLALPLHRDGGVVYLSHDLRAIEHLRDTARAWLLGIGALLAVAGIAFAGRTATRLSKPLLALTAASDRMGRGELTVRVDPTAMDDELQRLGTSFNAMAQTVQALVADVTDKAARAEAANRAKDGFLTSISHELRTPLTGIQSTAELLQQFGDDASPEERAEFLATILRESERLGRRIGDALEFANLAGGKTKWTVGRVDLQRTCEEACRRLDSLRQMKNVAFSITNSSEVPLTGDREHLTQAVHQLLSNAWTWSPENGTVDVTVRDVPGGHVVEVADRGPGIPAHERQRIFDAFSQGGDVLVDKPAGIGIGLKIAMEVAIAHGGGVEYDDRPGGGACFRMLVRHEDRPIDRCVGTTAAATGAAC